jgi:hypothetical protein
VNLLYSTSAIVNFGDLLRLALEKTRLRSGERAGQVRSSFGLLKARLARDRIQISDEMSVERRVLYSWKMVGLALGVDRVAWTGTRGENSPLSRDDDGGDGDRCKVRRVLGVQ